MFGRVIVTENCVLTSAVNKKPSFFYGYVIVIAAFFIMFMMSGMLYSYGIFFKPLAEEFGWSRAVTSGAYSTMVLLLGITFIITGRLTDRFGPRLVITVCGAVLGLGYILTSQVHAVWQLYLFYSVIVALGSSGGLIPTMSTVARWFVKKRGLMTGIMVTGIGIGQVVISTVSTHFLNTYGWRTTYVILGVTLCVIVVTAAQFLKRDPGQIGQLPDGETVINQRRPAPEVKGYTRREALHTRQFWMLIVVYFCEGYLVQGTMVHIVPHATDLGISAIAAASVIAVIGGVSAAGRISMGVVGDRIGNKRGLIIVFVIAFAAFLWLQTARELWMFYLFAVVFGFAYGGLVVLESPMIAELFGLKAHGAIMGVIHFGATIGGATSPLLAGRLFDATDSYKMAFLILVAVSILGLTMASLLKPTPREGAALIT